MQVLHLLLELRVLARRAHLGDEQPAEVGIGDEDVWARASRLVPPRQVDIELTTGGRLDGVFVLSPLTADGLEVSVTGSVPASSRSIHLEAIRTLRERGVSRALVYATVSGSLVLLLLIAVFSSYR